MQNLQRVGLTLWLGADQAVDPLRRRQECLSGEDDTNHHDSCRKHRLPVQVQIREYCMLMELGYAVKDNKDRQPELSRPGA
jgi:hypothetical protein